MVDSVGSGGSSSTLRFLNDSKKSANKSLERLGSGSRLNRASDDAAGLAIAEALSANYTTTRRAGQNVDDGLSAISIVDGATSQISDILTRQSELATQAANGTLSNEQRSALNTEYQALEEEKTRIAETTTFNGQQLFDSGNISIQAGTDASNSSQILLASPSSSGFSVGGDISSQAAAQSALDSLSNALSSVSEARAQIGAVESRLNSASESLASREVETKAAESRIRDADVAEEVANLIAANIRSDGATATLAQSKNLNATIVQKLLN